MDQEAQGRRAWDYPNRELREREKGTDQGSKPKVVGKDAAEEKGETEKSEFAYPSVLPLRLKIHESL